MGDCLLKKYDTYIQMTLYYRTTYANQEITFPKINSNNTRYYLVRDYGSNSVLYLAEEDQTIVVPNVGDHYAEILRDNYTMRVLTTFPTIDIYKIVIGDKVIDIESEFMKNKNTLEEIEFSLLYNSLETIGIDAFYNSALRGIVDLRGSITSIGKGAFCNCKTLEGFNTSGSIISQYYETGTYGELISKRDNDYGIVCYPAGNTSVAYNCNARNINNGIRGKSFHGCENLTSIYIYNGTVQIDFTESSDIGKNNPFVGCTNLRSVTLYPNTGTFFTDNGIIKKYQYGIETIMFCPQKNTTPNLTDVRSVSTCAFEKNTSLIRVEVHRDGYFPSYVGYNPFMYCENLSEFWYYNSQTSAWNIIKRYLYCTVAGEKCLVAYGRRYSGNENTIYKADIDVVWHNAFYGTSQATLYIQNGITLYEDSIPDYVNVIRFD